MYKPENEFMSTNIDEHTIINEADELDEDYDDEDYEEDNLANTRNNDELDEPDEISANLINSSIESDFNHESEAQEQSELESEEQAQESSILQQLTKDHATAMVNQELLANEVTITAEIARINLTMQEFIHLQVGDKLPLANLPASVKLCVNGKYIAEGVLVEINQRVGVKITRILK